MRSSPSGEQNFLYNTQKFLDKKGTLRDNYAQCLSAKSTTPRLKARACLKSKRVCEKWVKTG